MKFHMVITLVFCMFSCTSSQNGCKLADQPFIVDYEIERIIGRWYLVYMAGSFSEDSRGGSVIDIYQENGKLYLSNTYLSPLGECQRSSAMEIRRQQTGEYFTLYAKGQRVADVRVIGGDFVHYSVDHYCAIEEEGVCKYPLVHIWSRTKELPNKILFKAREEMEKLCLPPHIYKYDSSNYEQCPIRETAGYLCQLRYIPFVRSMDANKLVGIWYHVAWFNNPGADPPADSKGYLINVQEYRKAFYYIPYIVTDTDCEKLRPVSLLKTSPGGRMKQYGRSDNGTEIYFPFINYDRYLVAWVCAKLDKGVCKQFSVRVWSRTPNILESDMNKARAYKNILCKPEREMTYERSAYEVCKNVTTSEESTQNGCKLADQPFIPNREIEKLMGRWYLVLIVSSTSGDVRGGSVVDIYQENGKFYARNLHLTSDGDCLPPTITEFQRSQNGDYYTIYHNNKKVADVRHIGSDFVHYSVDYYCSVVESGVCRDPYVQIWSRSRKLANNLLSQAKEEMKKVCLPPNIYNYESGKYDKCPHSDSVRDFCQSRYIPFVKTLDAKKFVGFWYLAAWFYHPDGDPPADFTGYVMNLRQYRRAFYYIPYTSNANGCERLEPVSLIRTSKGGQMRQYGGPHNGSDTYFSFIDYERYLVAWVCNTMNNGICPNSVVQVWSRTPTLNESDMKEARAYLKFLCKPEREATYDGSAYEVCNNVTSEENMCQVWDIPFVSSLDSKKVTHVMLLATYDHTFDQSDCSLTSQLTFSLSVTPLFVGIWYLAGWFNHPGGDPPADIKGYIIDLQEYRGTFYYIPYAANDRDCKRLEPISLKQTYEGGRMRQYGRSHNGSVTYFPYIEYDRYMVEWVCSIMDNNLCLNPIVRVWSRTTNLPKSDMDEARTYLKFLCNPEHKMTYDATGYRACENTISPETTTQNGCKLVDQPFLQYPELERIMGRWYLMFTKGNTSTDNRGGSVVDLYQENGKFYSRNVNLSPDGECLPPTIKEFRQRKENYYTVYYNDQKVADMRWIGGDLAYYRSDHYCSIVEDGVCKNPLVQIWSRTRELPTGLLNKAKEEVKKICLPTNVYNYQSRTYDKCPNLESERDICQQKYIPFVRSLDATKFVGTWYLTGWFNHPGGDPPEDMKGYVINMEEYRGAFYYVPYFANDTKCKKLEPITLRRTSAGGQMRQYGGSHNGSEIYFPYIDYDRFLVAWICTAMDNGVCTKSSVRVWSRTPTLPESDMDKARAYLVLLCKPDREVTYNGFDHEACKHAPTPANGAVLISERLVVVTIGAIVWTLSESI